MPSKYFLLIVRCFAALALTFAGYIVATRNIAAVISKDDPLYALKISGNDARIMGRAAQAQIEQAKSDRDRLQAALLARRALLRDGTAVTAADTVGLSSINSALQEKWFDYAARLSRRDLPAQLYFIEKSVSEGDVKEALHHYDIALRTAQEGGTSVLFPILRNAIIDSAIRRELTKTLQEKPLWSGSFLANLVTDGPDYAAAAELLTALKSRGVAIAPDIEERLLNNLVGRGQIQVAWRYYVFAYRDIASSLIRNATFRVAGARNTPFDWQLTSGDGVSVDLGVGKNDTALNYQLSPTIGSRVIRQVTLLTPGRYRLDSYITESSQPLGSGPFWEFKCADGRLIGSLEMGAPIPAAGRFSASYSVPDNCSTQMLTLVVRASEDVQGATGTISSVSLSKVE
jgi:hypothetical protein